MLWSAYTHIVASGKIADGPVLLLGLTWNASSAGNGVIAYNDVEGRATNKIVETEAGANLTGQFLPRFPIYCERGLYVKLDSNIDDCTVFWRLVSKNVES
jgi:hypothetical protein